MLCDVCREGLEGIWDPEGSKRLGLLKNFPEIMEKKYGQIDEGNYDEVLDESELQDPERYLFGHHTNYDSLLRSKHQGCVACNDFGYLNDRDDVNPTFAGLGYYSTFCVLLSRTDMSCPTMLVYSGEILEEFFWDMVAHDENDEVNSIISHSTSDAQTWGLLQTWVDRCLKSHELCRRQDAALFSPTRLLQLVYTGSDKLFRLVNFGEFDPRERYITLSHCWGPGRPEEKLRLLKSSEDELREGLPIATLPKTFRDAFEVIGRLEIRYLWIDRLCIFQDSEEDWQAEASSMQSIYRHGLLNIAALGASDDQGGCFVDRDPSLFAPTVVKLKLRDDGVAALYRCEAERESWRKDFEEQPLLSRGWVLQERILSTRNLYFGNKQIFWECFDTNCCETVPKGCLTQLERPGSLASRPKPDKHAWKPLIDPGRTTSTYLTSWSDVVQAYSQCNLTYPRDKLIALSGLAKRMKDSLKAAHGPGHDTYLAGLWEHTMPQSLLWKPKIQGRHFSSYRAPSWSWASLDGTIIVPATGAVRWHVDVLRAKITPKGSDVTGQLNGGALLLRGHVCIARRFKRLKTRLPERETYSIGSFHHPESQAPIEFGDRSAYLQFDTKDSNYETVSLMLFYMRPHRPFSFVSVHCLALAFANELRSCYRRVGYAILEETIDLEDQGFEDKLLSKFPTQEVEII